RVLGDHSQVISPQLFDAGAFLLASRLEPMNELRQRDHPVRLRMPSLKSLPAPRRGLLCHFRKIERHPPIRTPAGSRRLYPAAHDGVTIGLPRRPPFRVQRVTPVPRISVDQIPPFRSIDPEATH